MVMGHEGTRNGDCGGDVQQQFSRLTDHSRETKVGVWSLVLAAATKRRLVKTAD
jgi:hypothetical protein